MRSEWITTLTDQGEEGDYLEKLSNKELYRAYLGQEGELAKMKRAEEEEKAREKSRKAIAFNKRTHEERKVMFDFLKARGESGKKLGPMSFMNLQDLYKRVKNEEEDRLKKTNLIKRGSETEEERKRMKPKTESLVHPPSILHVPSLRIPSTTPKVSTQLHLNCSLLKRNQSLLPALLTQERLYPSSTVTKMGPDTDLQRILQLGEEEVPNNDSGKHLLLVTRHHFNPIKEVVVDAKPLQAHYPLVNRSYNASVDEYTITNVKGNKIRGPKKAILKMPRRNIKTLYEIPFGNPRKDTRGYETARIIIQM
ncbi:hypothetical protein L1987_18583 [Smallanthus sonchifolius]|uniref:Uncharacterized protein n=1 Tax=Smallanthus sonchifolius TaxID=185202 RepID=A0ACB9J061_9ASTR|nr:hypothetical protein L1987_18583 [Smallanthus sonchifolius]